MKQILMILIVGLITAGKIDAQQFKRFNYQLDVGTTLTIPYKSTIEIMPEFKGHPQTNYSSNLGYFFEALILYNLNSKFSINTGLNYNYTALGINDKLGFTENKGNLTNSYVTMPVMITHRLSDKTPISISAGPYFGLLVSAYEKGTSYIDTAEFAWAYPDPVLESVEPKQKYEKDVKKGFNAIDYGVILQLDYEIKLTQGLQGVILTRLNCGLNNVLTKVFIAKSSAMEWKNYNVMIGFGLKL